MRCQSLLISSFFVLTAFGAIPQLQAQSNPEPSTIVAQSDSSRYYYREYRSLHSPKIAVLPGSDPVCLKLRTYVVHRVSPYSDVTHMHSYSTCQPSWKFEARNALRRETKAGDRPSYW